MFSKFSMPNFLLIGILFSVRLQSSLENPGNSSLKYISVFVFWLIILYVILNHVLSIHNYELTPNIRILWWSSAPVVHTASAMMHWKGQENDHRNTGLHSFPVYYPHFCLVSKARCSYPYFEHRWATRGPLLKLAPTSFTDNLTPSGRLLWIISKNISANVALKPLICKRKEDALREGTGNEVTGQIWHGLKRQLPQSYRA